MGYRGRPARARLVYFNLQNECVRRYPDSLYFKIDEDTFVSADWDQELLAAYEAHRDRPDLSLVTATIPNNGLGCWQLLNVFPDLREKFLQLPHAAHHPGASSPVWFYPHLAEWMIREFIHLDTANQRVRAVVTEPWVTSMSASASIASATITATGRKSAACKSRMKLVGTMDYRKSQTGGAGRARGVPPLHLL